LGHPAKKRLKWRSSLGRKRKGAHREKTLSTCDKKPREKFDWKVEVSHLVERKGDQKAV